MTIKISLFADGASPQDLAALGAMFTAMASTEASNIKVVSPLTVIPTGEDTSNSVKGAPPITEKKPARRRKAAPKKEEPAAEVPKKEEPAAEVPKKEEPAAEADALTNLRTLLSQKVATHRDAIVKKLKESGAKNLSNLDPKHYETMATFMTNL